MEKEIILVGIPGSGLAREIAAHLSGTLFTPRILSVDAPFEGRAVTFAPGTIVWEGVELLEASAIFAECSVFNWPQALLPFENDSSGLAYKEWAIFQREARSLVVSSLWAAGRERPMINPPSAAHLALSPSIALDYLKQAGIQVHPWSVESAPPDEGAGAGLVLDVCGRERWHSPRRPPAGDPALVLEPHDNEVVTFMVAGGSVLGALRYARGESWAKRQTGSIGADEPGLTIDLAPFSEAADLAKRSTEALGLVFAAVSVRAGAHPPSVMLVEASPDLESWNAKLAGRVARSLADCLVAAASS